jgi:hypothetical protein
MFGLGPRGRITLIVLTLVGMLFWPHVDTLRVAAAESNAVATLRQLRSALESNKVDRQQPGYPQTLPNIEHAYPLQNPYRFEYVPTFSSKGTIDTYVIKATPLRRSCGCTRSFTIGNDGSLYFTLEERAATASDQPVQ